VTVIYIQDFKQVLSWDYANLFQVDCNGSNSD